MISSTVTQFLDSAGVEYVIKPHSMPVFTCEAAAEQRGVRVSQIVKCMVGQAEAGLVAMLIPGDKSLKSSKARKYLKVPRLDLVSPEDLEQRWGLTVGAISPTQLVGKARILMDPSVFEENVVDISSGDPLAGVELSPRELLRVLGAEIVEIVSLNH